MKALALISAVVVLALSCAGTAVSANNPNPRLDAAASFVAGHPVTVWCETSWASWLQMTGGVSDASGFTNPSQSSVVYVDPQVCLTFEMILAGSNVEDVGGSYTSQALLTLAHEAEHQKGLTDEGQTDCAALPLVPTLATQFFGVPKTITQTVTAYRTISVRVGKAKRRIRESYTKTVSAPNPYVTQLATDAEGWHKLKPPAYQGSC